MIATQKAAEPEASKSEESNEKLHEELIDGSDEKSTEGTESHQ